VCVMLWTRFRGSLAYSVKHGNETLLFTRREVFLDHLGEYQFLKEDPAFIN
jgi:hypothetical protein